MLVKLISHLLMGIFVVPEVLLTALGMIGVETIHLFLAEVVCGSTDFGSCKVALALGIFRGNAFCCFTVECTACFAL